MVEITPSTQKGILLRFLLLLITIEINSTAKIFIQDPNNNVFKQAQPLNLSLHIFLLPPLAELGIFVFANVFSQRRFWSTGLWCKACLFVFVIGVCPAICVMENHRMNEVKFFYGRWHCVYDYIPETFQKSMRKCPVGNNRTVTCFRERDINDCFSETWDIIPIFALPEPYSKNGEYFKTAQPGFYVREGNTKEYPKFAGTYLCNPPPHERIERRGVLRGCDVEKYTERIDQNNFWTFMCYYRQKETGHLRKYGTTSANLCSKVKTVCRSKNVTDFYPSMKMQCRLADLTIFICVSIACWILPNYTLTSGKLPTLLLWNMLSAADIFDLLDCFDEPLAPIPHLWSTVTCVWSASLLHLYFSNISSLDDTTLADVELPINPEDVENGQQDAKPDFSPSPAAASAHSGPLTEPKSKSLGPEEPNNNSSLQDAQNACLRYFPLFCEVGAIIMPVVLLDVPFLHWRCYLLSRVNRYNPHIFFFAEKNVLCIVMQLSQSLVLLVQRFTNLRQ